MDTISIEKLTDYSQDLELDVDLYEGLILAYSSTTVFDTMYLEDDIEWKKENGEDHLPLEILHKYMDHNNIEECYIEE
jgi:hypothetical protein